MYEDKGIVYYFLTANALGSILDDSEPERDTDISAAISDPTTNTTDITPVIESSSSVNLTQDTVTPVVEEFSQTIVIPSQANISVAITEESMPISPSPVSEEETTINSPSESNLPPLSQSELAKRLEVSPTTIAKRKSQRDFSLWSKSRDPDGVSWKYVEETKLFISE